MRIRDAILCVLLRLGRESIFLIPMSRTVLAKLVDKMARVKEERLQSLCKTDGVFLDMLLWNRESHIEPLAVKTLCAQLQFRSNNNFDQAGVQPKKTLSKSRSNQIRFHATATWWSTVYCLHFSLWSRCNSAVVIKVNGEKKCWHLFWTNFLVDKDKRKKKNY